MSLGARVFRNERIGGFLYAVVGKPIGVLRADDQFGLESFPKCCFGLLFGRLENRRKHGGFGAISDAGKLLECLLRCNWKPVQLVDHEVHNVVGITLSANGIQIPAPSGISMIESDQFLFDQGMDKLKGKKRIAGRLPVYELRERRGALRFTTKGVR